jgi:hypothetical protein
MRLHGEAPPRDGAQVITSVSARCGFDGSPYQRVVALKRGTALANGETERVLEGYLSGMTTLVGYLNTFSSTG